jgi:hypothetical protein
MKAVKKTNVFTFPRLATRFPGGSTALIPTEIYEINRTDWNVPIIRYRPCSVDQTVPTEQHRRNCTNRNVPIQPYLPKCRLSTVQYRLSYRLNLTDCSLRTPHYRQNFTDWTVPTVIVLCNKMHCNKIHEHNLKLFQAEWHILSTLTPLNVLSWMTYIEHINIAECFKLNDIHWAH